MKLKNVLKNYHQKSSKNLSLSQFAILESYFYENRNDRNERIELLNQ